MSIEHQKMMGNYTPTMKAPKAGMPEGKSPAMTEGGPSYVGVPGKTQPRARNNGVPAGGKFNVKSEGI